MQTQGNCHAYAEVVAENFNYSCCLVDYTYDVIPAARWYMTVVGNLDTEVFSLPFNGFYGESLHCLHVV